MTIAFCVLMLAMNPDIQEKVVEEMKSVFDTADQSVTYDDLSKLNYLTMVMEETLRLFPITPFIVREVTKDIEIGTSALEKKIKFNKCF